MSVITFDPTGFLARYPEFSTVATASITACFNEATLYLDNTGNGLVSDVPTLTVLFNMLTAHITAMNFGVNGEMPSQLVGRVASASEGSVSVSTDAGGVPGSAAWFLQTKYGYAYWQATRQYRTFQYIQRQPTQVIWP